MLASYLLSRTLVPTMMAYLLGSELICTRRAAKHAARPPEPSSARPPSVQRGSSRGSGFATWVCSIGRCAIAGRCCMRFPGFLRRVAGAGLRWSARISSPTWIPARCAFMRAVRPARASKRPEARFAAIEREIRAVIPPDEIEMLIDNIGIPNSWPAIAQGDIPTISTADGEILISLNKEKHGSTRDYEVLLRKRLRHEFPDMTFFFQPANITSQILNFGLPAPIDLQVVGRNAEANYKIAQRLAEKISHIPGRGRRPRAPGCRPAGNPAERRSREGVADGTDAARRHQQHADLPERQRHGRAELLDELVQRRQLQHRRADAAIPDRFPGRLAAHADLGVDQRREPHAHRVRRRARRRRASVSYRRLPSGASQAYGNPGAASGTTQLCRIWSAFNAPIRR